MQRVDAAGLAEVRWRLIAAIAAGVGLVQACGARASDVAEGEGDDPSPAGRAGNGSVQRPTGTTSPQAAAPAPSQAPAPPRDGEICYSPSDFDEVQGLAAIVNLLPDDALDANGCIASDYSGWLDGGGCNYDPRPAVMRGNRCCHLLDGSIPACGRPLVVDGAARTAPVIVGWGWASAGTANAPPAIDGCAASGVADSLPAEPLPAEPLPAEPLPAEPLSAELARRIGREWLADARLEHASVGSFASLALSLLAVGAPPELLAECQQASLDEVEHARACFTLASRFIGEPLGPGRLGLDGWRPATDLEELTVRTWLDGCVEETIAALIAAAQLELATDPDVRTALTRIAADEARHAELAWRIVAWALTIGGPGVDRALARAAEGLEPARDAGQPELTAPAPVADRPEPMPSVSDIESTTRAALHAHGRLSAAEIQNLRRRALREVIQPALGALRAAMTAASA